MNGIYFEKQLYTVKLSLLLMSSANLIVYLHRPGVHHLASLQYVVQITECL